MNPYITALLAVLAIVGVICEVIRTYDKYSVARIIFYVAVFTYLICELGSC